MRGLVNWLTTGGPKAVIKVRGPEGAQPHLQGRSDGGGVYRDIYPPKSVYLKFLLDIFSSYESEH